MAFARYLAMTAEEFSSAPSLPEKIAWMACHFSPYSTSLLNLPRSLPEASLLILNDSTPPVHQDCKNVAKIIEATLKEQKCSGLLLDFQHRDCPQNKEIAQALTGLDFPVCAPEYLAKELDCSVFLPPPPPDMPLREYIKPWQGRDIWLEAALSCRQIKVTDSGSYLRPVSGDPECPLADTALHCHYGIEKDDDSFIFTLKRTREDLDSLLAEAEALGITAAVGLYQELK